jgi:hypothetical protein
MNRISHHRYKIDYNHNLIKLITIINKHKEQQLNLKPHKNIMIIKYREYRTLWIYRIIDLEYKIIVDYHWIHHNTNKYIMKQMKVNKRRKVHLNNNLEKSIRKNWNHLMNHLLCNKDHKLKYHNITNSSYNKMYRVNSCSQIYHHLIIQWWWII